MVGFSSDKISILQHIHHLFKVIVLAPRALDGMNTVLQDIENTDNFTKQPFSILKYRFTAYKIDKSPNGNVHFGVFVVQISLLTYILSGMF